MSKSSDKTGRNLKLRLLWLQCAVCLLGTIILIIGNFVVFKTDWETTRGFWALEMTGLLILFITPSYYVSARVLSPLMDWFSQEAKVYRNGVEGKETGKIARKKEDFSDEALSYRISKARRAAFGYPWYAFLFFVAFGIVAPILFHLAGTLDEFGNFTADAEWWIMTSRIYLYEFNLSLSLGLIYFVLSKRTLRPFVLRLPPPILSFDQPKKKPGFAEGMRLSVKARLFIIIMALSFTVAMPFVVGSLSTRYIKRTLDPNEVFIMAAQGLGISAIVGFTLADDVSKDLSMVKDQMERLARKEDEVQKARGESTSALWTKISVTGDDEIADIVMAFNTIQTREKERSFWIERELDMARRVQAKILPSESSFRTAKNIPSGWDFRAQCLPAKKVGGDFYDVMDLGDGLVGFSCGDASGKGLPAALLMAATISLMRSEAKRTTSPKELLSSVNRLLCGAIPQDFFVSVIYAVLDTASGKCCLSRAGHVDPIIVEDRGFGPGRPRCFYLKGGSLPLGVDAETVYTDSQFSLAPGDSLMLYSDGIVESKTEEGRMLGFDGFLEAVEKVYGEQNGSKKNEHNIVQVIMSQLAAWRGPSGPEDDLTLLFCTRLKE